MKMRDISTEDLLWSKIEVNDAMQCWPWKGKSVNEGYGRFTIGPLRSGTGKYKSYRAHKMAYEEINGPVKDGLVLDHLCRNRLCCNPIHLQEVTVAENARRGDRARLRCAQGHLYVPETTVYRTNGKRCCRICERFRATAYQRRKRSRQKEPD